MAALVCGYGMEFNMNKSMMIVCGLVGITLIGSNEFTKKQTRKDKAQQEAAYNDCVQLIDTLIEQACRLQQKLADLTCHLYKKLRSCAVDEKPDLVHKEAQELRAIEQALQALKKQLQELEKAIVTTEKLL